MQSSSTLPILAIIIPCYNEQEIIEHTCKTITQYLNGLIDKNIISEDSLLCLVDDGSTDKTVNVLIQLQNNSDIIHIIKLSKNFGHQAALLAGMNYCLDKCDCAITIDADLQDDICAIEQMIASYKNGAEIVYGVRNNRTTDTIFKKTTALMFYSLMRFLGAETVKNHADYRLMSQRAIDYLLQFKEINLFLRGVVTEIGLDTDTVYYKRNERIAGETKYPFNKMLSFAIEGITSFSTKPLRIVTVLGLLIILVSLFVAVYILLSISSDARVQGWTSLIVSIWFLGGVQLFSIGILGDI